MAGPDPPQPRSNTFALGVAVAALAALLTHVRSLGAPFFADDWLFLDQTRHRSLGGLLTSPDPLGNYFRPLGRQLWFWLLGHASGESAVAFHAANLLCLIASVVLLALLARRVAGELAGMLAACFLALHYAADVPVLWASGSQELLSLALALAALALYERGWRFPAAAVYFCALLAKEVVILAPLVSVALDRSAPDWRVRARRAWPFGAALLAWVALAAWAMARRETGVAGLSLTPWAPVAVPLLLVRVALGLEWQTGAWPFARWTNPGALALVAVLCAGLVVLAATGPEPPGAPGAPRPRASGGARVRRAGRRTEPPPAVPGGARGLRAGLVWALAGALPVAVVAPVWSAYYFLFAIAGVALALGSLTAIRRWSPAAVTLTILVAGLASSQARGLREFATAPSAWSGQSHVNRFYLERGMHVIARGVADLREQRPHPEPRTTFFFAGLPSFAAFQVADGPLVRGAYRDSSLRGYNLWELTRERLARGPWAVFIFDDATGRLVDRMRQPGVFMSTALSQLLSGRFEVADAALEAAAANGEEGASTSYVGGLVAWALGDSARAIASFARAGDRAGRDAGEAVARAQALAAARDSAGAVTELRRALQASVLDPAVHALLADLLMARLDTEDEGELEAFAARVLDAESPQAWRRWAMVLAKENRLRESMEALDRYFTLRPAARDDDPRAVRLRAMLVRMLPGGDIMQRGLVKEMQR